VTLYKNLSLKKKRLYKLCWQLRLSEFHWTACQILLDVNGYDNAEGYLRKRKKPEKDLFL